MKRSLQYGTDTSRIDIMVRESIQNSFDALNEDAHCLDVNYSHGTFKTLDLASELEGLGDSLFNRFTPVQEFIELRDSNTSGLDGPLETSDINEYGKLIKLVYSIAEKQSGLGKGGSWGYGKTNYYNLGVGLVIYYTNTKFDGDYQQRLVAVLVEDGDHREDMLLPEAPLGISYWGTEGKQFKDRAIPVTNYDYIVKFLRIFGLEPFEYDQTGTSIIIPFIDRKILMDEMCRDIVDSNVKRDSVNDFRYFVELAVQRWYFPRLLNVSHTKYLRFSYNGELLAESDIDPLFKFLRNIYNETFGDKATSVSVGGAALSEKTVVAHYFSDVISGESLAFPYGMNVYGMLGVDHDPNRPNVPIGFRCRSLGMINKYDVNEGIVHNAVATAPNEYLFVGMRPEGNVPIINPSDKKPVGADLENYIRLGENASHTTWSDINLKTFGGQFDSMQPRIIQSIVRSISGDFTDRASHEDNSARRNLGLSKHIGKLFLPAHGFGRSPTSSRRSTGASRSGSPPAKTAKIGNSKAVRRGSSIFIECPLIMDDGKTVHKLVLSSPSSEEGRRRTIDEWSSEYELENPISMKSFEIVSINGEDLPLPVVMNKPDCYSSGQSFFETTGNEHSLSSLIITHSTSVREMTVRINIDCGSCPFKFNINLMEVE